MYSRVEDTDPKPGKKYMSDAENLIFLSMVHANLLGFVHSRKTISEQESEARKKLASMPEMFGVKSDVEEFIDEQTVDAILEDAGVDQEYVDFLEDEMDGMLTDRAKLDFSDNMRGLQKILATNVPTGLGFRDFMDQVGQDSIMQQLGLAGESPHYIENVYRTNYGTAHSVGRWKSAQESTLVSMLEYASIVDGGTTDICLELHGVIRKKSDPFWSQYYTLNHFS